MKAVLFYETAEHMTMEQIMEVYPRHAAVVDGFARQGKYRALNLMVIREGIDGHFHQ